jgi:serine/threonine-protein kinase
MSPEKDQDYFCEGMAEEIINALAKIKGLHVASRTSAFQFKAAAVDSQEIGRRLGVRTFLEGSVRKAGNRLRISAQLINTADGYHLWSDRYDREMEDVFLIQDEIAQAVVDTLKVKLLGPERVAVKRSKAPDISAYNLNLKGRYFWNQRSEEGLNKAISYFTKAIDKDPHYAPAYASLADTYSLLCAYHFRSPADSIPNAREAASRALELDNTSAEAHEAIGHVRLLAETSWKQAEKDYRRAIELNDGFATAHQRLALLYTVLGRREEADLEIERAQKLDPLSLIIQTDAALLCLIKGDPQAAISKSQEVLEMSPQFGVARFALGLALEEEGQFEQAVREFETAGDVAKANTVMAAAQGHALASSGDEASARSVLAQLDDLSNKRYVSPYSRAVVLAGLSEQSAAMSELERAFEEQSVWQVHLHLRVDPRLNSLRRLPAFENLVSRPGVNAQTGQVTEQLNEPRER